VMYREWLAVFLWMLTYVREQNAYVDTVSGLMEWHKSLINTQIMRDKDGCLHIESASGIKNFALLLALEKLPRDISSNVEVKILHEDGDLVLEFPEIQPSQLVTLKLDLPRIQ